MFPFVKAEPHLSFMNHSFYLLVTSLIFNASPAFQNPHQNPFVNINPRINSDIEKQLTSVFVFNQTWVRKLELY